MEDSMNPLRQLQAQGQAVWLDYIRRDILTDGSLQRMVSDDGVSGVTSNPAIFQKAIGESDLYDDALRSLMQEDPSASILELYEAIAVEDIQMATDILAPVFETSGGRDGFVSLEVSPHLAHDGPGSVAEARRLWQRVARPNLLIKIPATSEGIGVVEELLSEGINVNVTLMFSLDHYEVVAQAYLRAVERSSAPERLASVASFFVSRVDSKVDRALEAIGSDEALSLRGKIGIANCKLTYLRYQELFEGTGFESWRQLGAAVQRVLWASTSTKNPAYSDVLYIEELVGPKTVNTVPPSTFDAFRDHGRVRPTLLDGIDEARSQLEALAHLGIDLGAVTEELQREGVEKFAEPFDRLMATLAAKRQRLMGQPALERTAE
jgi:transaldolase